MPERTIEDKLREEYFDLLPAIRQLVWQMETEIRYRTLRILQSLISSEQLIIKSRVKECESAVKSLERRQEWGIFNRDKPDSYSLLSLPDLAGVRVLVFPRRRVDEVDRVLRDWFKDWNPDPVRKGTTAFLLINTTGIVRASPAKYGLNTRWFQC